MKKVLLRCGIVVSPILIGAILFQVGNANKSSNAKIGTSVEANASGSLDSIEEMQENTQNQEVTATTEGTVTPQPTKSLEETDVPKPTDVPESTDIAEPNASPAPTVTPELSQPEEKELSDGKSTAVDYDYSNPVPESETVDDSYFSDAVFIGNSRTEGFIMYSGLADTTAYTSRGVMVNTVFTEKAVKMNGTKLTIMDALAKTKFNKVYIMLGVNELGWSVTSVFKDNYVKIIDKIREINPDAQIYVQSILPVTKKKSNSDSTYNMKHINEFNQLIKDLTKEKEVYYVNVSEGVADSEGYLPEDSAWDGVHLKQDYCKVWLAYLKNHVVIEN